MTMRSTRCGSARRPTSFVFNRRVVWKHFPLFARRDGSLWVLGNFSVEGNVTADGLVRLDPTGKVSDLVYKENDFGGEYSPLLNREYQAHQFPWRDAVGLRRTNDGKIMVSVAGHQSGCAFGAGGPSEDTQAALFEFRPQKRTLVPRVIVPLIAEGCVPLHNRALIDDSGVYSEIVGAPLGRLDVETTSLSCGPDGSVIVAARVADSIDDTNTSMAILRAVSVRAVQTGARWRRSDHDPEPRAG